MAESKLVYVICGSEDFLRDLEYRKAAQAALAGADPQLALYEMDGDDAELAAVLDELRTLPFLCDRRVVALRNAEKFVSDHREAIENYFSAPCATGVLILEMKNWRENTKLAKLLRDVAATVKCDPIKAYQLPGWAASRASSAYSKRLEPTAARLLVELAGGELGTLDGELSKLATYVGDGKAIAAEHVEALVGHQGGSDNFKLADAISRGDAARALERLEEMYVADRSSLEMTVGGLTWHLRRLRKARALLKRGLTPDQVCHEMNVSYFKDQFVEQVQGFTDYRLQKAGRELAQADLDIKTGLSETRTALQKYILKVCGDRRPAAEARSAIPR